MSVEHRPVGGDGILGVTFRVVTGRTGTDRRQGWVVAVVCPPLTVVVDQFGVWLDRVGDVGREQRVTVPGSQIDRLLAGGAAVPDSDRLLQRPGPDLGVPQRGPEPQVGGDLVLSPDPAEKLVGLGVAVPLVVGGDVEQLPLGGAVALADDQFQPAAGEVVKGGVVLVGPHRVEQAQRRDRGEQPDPGGKRGQVTEHDRRGGGDERPFVPFPHPEAVEAEFLGQ